MQETQLAANVVEADLDQRIMVAFNPQVGLPVHALGFAAITIQNASSQPKRLRSLSARLDALSPAP